MYSLLKRGALIAIFILIYFYGVREIRGLVHNLHLGTILPEEYGEFQEGLKFYAPSSVSFAFFEDVEVVHKQWSYKIPFGMFFLFGCLGLIALGSVYQSYVYLIGIHLAGGMISFIGLILALNLSIKFLILPDLISSYLVPLCSLGLVALSYIQRKEALKE